MSVSGKCNFHKGIGIPYDAVYHLLDGTRKIDKKRDSNDGNYYHDENIRGYGLRGPDHEVQEINRMELQLGELSPAVRDLRTMLDFCCIWRYDYPERVHQICRAIGGGADTLGRCHYQVGTDKRDELTAYALAMQKWLGMKGSERNLPAGVGAVQEKVAERVFSLLGERDGLKELLVERTLIGLCSRHIDCSFFGSDGSGKPIEVFPSHALNPGRDWHERMRMLEHEIQTRLGGRSYDFLCEVGGAEPPCHFKFIRRLEILIGSIGCLSWRGQVPPKDSRVSGRRELTQQYLAVLHAYWSDDREEDGRGGDERNRSLQEALFTDLGKPELYKRWLIASLWKNIKNQTLYQAFTMKHWVDFVQIVRRHVPSH